MSPDPAPPDHDQGHDPIPFQKYRVSSPGIARVVSNERLTPEGRDDVRHLTINLEGLGLPYLEGQSLGVLVPGPGPDGKPPKLRLYSISSSRSGDDGAGHTASLCVKRVVAANPDGTPRLGLASNYLCDLKPGDELAVTGPTGKAMLLPEDPEAPLICVGTGTGIAPYRGFVRRIYQETPGRQAPFYLYFGVRTAADCLYREDLERPRDHPGFHLRCAFSREQSTLSGERLYVQHRLAEDLPELWPLLDRGGAHLYICGLKGMEAGVEAAVEAYARGLGVDWPAWREAFRRSGRLRVETY